MNSFELSSNPWLHVAVCWPDDVFQRGRRDFADSHGISIDKTVSCYLADLHQKMNHTRTSGGNNCVIRTQHKKRILWSGWVRFQSVVFERGLLTVDKMSHTNIYVWIWRHQNISCILKYIYICHIKLYIYCPVSIQDTTSERKICQLLETARFMFKDTRSIWNGRWLAYLSNTNAIW